LGFSEETKPNEGRSRGEMVTRCGGKKGTTKGRRKGEKEKVLLHYKNRESILRGVPSPGARVGGVEMRGGCISTREKRNRNGIFSRNSNRHFLPFRGRRNPVLTSISGKRRAKST